MMARGDRLGVRWGLAGGMALASIDEVAGRPLRRRRAGSTACGSPMPTPSTRSWRWRATADETAGLAEVGTSVVPLYGRHPIGLAQLARTAQSALGGRFTLGIGAASTAGGEGRAWACRGIDRSASPATSSTVCNRCCAGEQADVDGSEVTTHGAAQHHRRRHADPAGRARTEDARARRPPRAGHDGRSMRAAHDRLVHRADHCGPPPTPPDGPSRGSWR